MEATKSVITKIHYGAIALILGVVFTAVALAAFTPRSASAAACENANIVYCGLNGNDVNTTLASLQKKYTQNSDHGHNDIQAVMQWAGASSAAMQDNASQWQMGTMYRSGDIKAGGKTVGKDAWVAARFTKGSGYTPVTKGVWARKTTTYLREKSTPVLIHMSQGGNADFAVMTTCGNAVKFTPVAQAKPKPTPAPAPTQPTPTPTAPAPAPAPTPTLPSTGSSLTAAGIGVFGTAFTAGTVGYRLYLRRKQLV